MNIFHDGIFPIRIFLIVSENSFIPDFKDSFKTLVKILKFDGNNGPIRAFSGVRTYAGFCIKKEAEDVRFLICHSAKSTHR